MAGYQTERDTFLFLFAREFPQARIGDALALLRAATGAQRWNEIATSIDVGDAERARLERASQRRLARVRKIEASIGAALETSGDPRGNPYTLYSPQGTRVSVPGRGLPARCFR